MATQDITKALQDNIQAFNTADWKRFKESLTPNGVYEEMGTQRRILGAEENVKVVQAWKQAFPDAKGTIQRIFASGNTVSAEIVWEGTHKGDLLGPGGAIKATGKRVKVPATMVATVEGGKLKETHHYFDLLTMLQQIGVAPLPKA